MAGLAGEGFRATMVERLRTEHVRLAARWLERLTQLLPIPAAEVFPSNTLLDHIPELILDIADYLHMPAQHEIAANTRVLAKARELGALRYAQRASIHQIMREYRLLEAVLLAFVREQSASLTPPIAADEAIGVTAHIHLAVSVLQESTVDSFIGEHSNTIAEQTRRLESFNRMVSHELRQPLAAVQVALKLSRAQAPGPPLNRLLALVDRNIDVSWTSPLHWRDWRACTCPMTRYIGSVYLSR